MRAFPTRGVVVFLMVLLITLIIAGCTNAVNVQTKSAKARLAVTQARGSPTANSPNSAPEPAVRYELAESTGNATCDNILKSIYPLVNVAIAEEEKQEKLLLGILGEVEKAREDVKQQKAVLVNAKKSCTGVNFEGTTQGDPLADQARNNAANNPNNNNAEVNETPECRALRNAERQLDNARRDRNAKENTLQELEKEKQDEERKDEADRNNETIASLQRDIASTQNDTAKQTEDIDRFKDLVKEKRKTCEGGVGGAETDNATTTRSNNQTGNTTRTCTSVAIRKIEAELEELRADLAELEEEKTQKEEELERAEDEEKDDDIERIEEDIADLDEDINAKEDDIRDLERDLRDLQEDC